MGLELLQETLEDCTYADHRCVCEILQENCIQFLEHEEIPYRCLQSVPDELLPNSTEGLRALGLGLSFFENPTVGLVQRLRHLTNLE